MAKAETYKRCECDWERRLVSIEWQAEDRWIDWYPDHVYNLYMSEADKDQATLRIRRGYDDAFKLFDPYSTTDFISRYMVTDWTPRGNISGTVSG